MYIEVPIVGSGTREDPYRAGINVSKSCLIPTNPDGTPQNTTALVWVADKYDAEVDRSIRRIPAAEGRALARQIDPKVNTDSMEQKRTRR